MPKVRGNPGQKFVNRAGVATAEYTQGVQSPRTPWAAAATAAAGSQAAGVQAAIAAKRFEKGIAKAGDAKWAAKAAEKGAQRYAPGVQAGRTDYETGVAPYLSAIQAISLPPRGPKGDPRNIQRVALIADTLRKVKLAS